MARRDRAGLLVAAVLLSVAPRAVGEDLRSRYQNVLAHVGVPSASEDWSFAPASDQGSWQGYALPSADDLRHRGSFAGPFLMAEGRWLGSAQARLEIEDATTGEWIDLGVAQNFHATSLPGGLVQRALADDLEVEHRLWFDSTTTALVETRVVNRGTEPRELRLSWTGSFFDEVAAPELEAGRIVGRTESGWIFQVSADGEVTTEVVDQVWSLRRSRARWVQPASEMVGALALTLTLEDDPESNWAAIERTLDEPEISAVANAERWNRYLESSLQRTPPNHPWRIVAVKAVQTLINNWRGPAGRMRYSSLFPSSNVGYFNGFWAWDSWKHAVALVRFAPEIAKDQVRAMFDHQNEQGMVADVVYLDAGEDNWRDTKPPLAGWAIEQIYRATRDLEFVAELYPKLVAYHRFWYTERDHDGDGLCEYGSTDGTLVAARWESGMDNAVRFDDSEMLENGPGAWSMNQESVDLNSYLYREKLALSELAEALGKAEEAATFRAAALELGKRIREVMFDPESGWFYDVSLDGSEFVSVRGPEGWTPLWTGVATAEQAARVRATMLDPKVFRTHVPFPTVARDEPGFSDGYWRGLVWLDQAYFAVSGLRRYGYGEDADALTRQLVENLDGALSLGEPLYENYHPLTGEGRNVRHFSWTAAHLLLLVLRW